ncbi:retrovirus-related Pol polyprotein from transposon 17.6 [Trichonephila clavipes]|nr:retrovirus-related Pol polyprotein from transposon 17.6 [Trichonephila clavipes]
MSSDPNDFAVISPGHFLIGGPLQSLPEPNLTDKLDNHLSQWQKLTKFVQFIWRKWRLDYLNNLQARHKWQFEKENVTPSSMVILKDENLPPCKWTMGRILEIVKGSDAKFRVVKVKTPQDTWGYCKQQLLKEGADDVTGLDSKIKNRLFQLLISHKSAFARSTVELSAAATEHHRINLQHEYPIKCPIYKIPFNLRNEFRRQIADLEKAGIISKSNSQYNTPALFVKQKEKWRLVLDFRKLNEITLTQDFVIPTLDDILHEISGSNYFSALDMKSAFNQIPLHFADKHKTAFSTPDGDKFELNRLCFGLKNWPKAFQFIAQEVLGDLLHNGALVYIDDIILFTKTIDEHFELLVTPEGILINKDKSVSINEFPVPTDQKQIKSFLGCCNFYRRYIKNFAKRALPLTNLLRKDTPFEWTSETQEAFYDIKKAILNPPVSALPDPNAELQITTDASSRGIGAVLEQKYPNSEVKPLYFFSKKLNPSQSKYNATVLEFLSIYTALNFFRPFLLGRKSKVFTDHKPLARISFK